jgi:sugar lactone lactonase YvrE
MKLHTLLFLIINLILLTLVSCKSREMNLSNNVLVVSAPTASTVPGAPTIGTATAGNAQATISFTAPASNGGATITSYTVTSSPNNFTATGATSPIIVTGLTNTTAYTFTVKATNSVGVSIASAASNSATPSGILSVPGAPTIVAATAGNAQATISFTAPASDGGAAITAYTVTSSPGTFTATGVASPIIVTGLTNTTAYTFTVHATNSVGSSLESAASNSATPVLHTYTVSTLAGSNGVSGAADGTGTAATFNSPTGVTVDSSGNVFVADFGNLKIRKITSAGVVTTFAGDGSWGSTNGPGATASFKGPTGIVIDGAGNLYVTDSWNNHVIRKITSAGVVSTLAGTMGVAGAADGIGVAATFTAPTGIAIDNTGTILYVTDNQTVIRKIIIATGVVTTLAGQVGIYGSADGTGSAATFNGPTGIAVDGSGNIYVSDSNTSVRKITSAGVVTTFVVSTSFNGPYGLAIDTAGNIYVGDTSHKATTSSHTIQKITPAGVLSTIAGSSGIIGSADGTGTVARFNFPYGIAVDSAGNLYIADKANHLIRKMQ